MQDEAVFEETFFIEGGNFSKAGKVSAEVKRVLKEIGLDASIIRRLAIAVYESEMNVVAYADKGEMNLQIFPDKVRVSIQDQGQGIPDIELAMQEGYSTATEAIREMGFGAGMGLPNMKKNVDFFEIESTVGEGTRIRMEVLVELWGSSE